MQEKDKLLWQCSLEELRDYLQDNLAINQNENSASNKRYVYGIKGLQDLFHCCHTTACKIKKSGTIDAAISQRDRKIVIDAELALELNRLNKSKKNGYK